MLTSGWEPIPNSKIGTGFRKRKPMGGWMYYYPKKAPGRLLQLTKPQLHKMLEGQGGYSIISAGRNEKDPRENKMEWDHPEFIARHKKLLRDLKKHGLDHVEGLGVYDGKELSVVVPHRRATAVKPPAFPHKSRHGEYTFDGKKVHFLEHAELVRGRDGRTKTSWPVEDGDEHTALEQVKNHVKSYGAYHDHVAKINGRTPVPELPSPASKVAFVRHKHPSEFEIIRHLGKKYNQDSVIHSAGGEHEAHYTTHHGGKEGQIAKGKGHNIAGDDATNYYTLTPHPDDSTGPIRAPAGAGTGKPATKWSLNVDWDNLHPAEKARFKAKKLPDGKKKRPTGRPVPAEVQSAISFALDF